MLPDFLNLPQGSKVMYLDIYNQICSAIKSGALKSGDRLPSLRELSKNLRISRTTVENAYMKLCIEGYLESLPQRGYFICERADKSNTEVSPKAANSKTYKYDFSTRKTDISAADTQRWKKCVRQALNNLDELVSYGDSQGERVLRQALCEYSFKARGVTSDSDDIVIGAGIGPLLNILCSLGIRGKIGFENGGFVQAQHIFEDYGAKTVILSSDENGAETADISKQNPDILFLQPSALGKISVNALAARRRAMLNWANEQESRYIIEDDYNGELRYTARSVSALQGKAPDKIIYIGSFSKLLLPSVRIAYMVLPKALSEKFRNSKNYYNATCGKTEQLALADYINSGTLEKQLRRLRKTYYAKSRLLTEQLRLHFGEDIIIEGYESSVSVVVKTSLTATSPELCEKAEKADIKIMPSKSDGSFRLCFSGIPLEDIPASINLLAKSLKN